MTARSLELAGRLDTADHPVDTVIADLGRSIEGAWNGVDYDEAAFASIAAEKLAGARLPERLSHTSVLRWGLTTRVLPRQQDRAARFGDPPVTVFVGRRFAINVLFWLDSTTAVHQHGFSGAFQVLRGSSIHTTFSFDVERAVTEAFVLGRLRSMGSRLLRAGSIEPIKSRSQLIHSLFHLDRPSVSIVVRTLCEQAAQPQLAYERPYVAFDPYFSEDWSDLQLHIAKHLLRCEHEDTEQLLGATLADADAHTVFRLLTTIQRYGNPTLAMRLAERARPRHKHVIDALLATLKESARIEFIASRRAQVTSPHLRFFLALLLNLDNRRDILRLARDYVDDRDPVDAIVGWIQELSGITAKLQVSGGAAWEPNLLGLPKLDATFFDVLARTLRGHPPDASPQDAQALETLRRSRAFGSLFVGSSEELS